MANSYIDFACVQQKLARTDEKTVAEGASVLVARFDLCPKWEGLTVYARFRHMAAVYDVPIVDGCALIPWEVVTYAGFDVSVWGDSADGGRLTSAAVSVPVARSIEPEGVAPLPSTPSQMEMFIKKTTEAEAAAARAAQSAKEAAEAAASGGGGGGGGGGSEFAEAAEESAKRAQASADNAADFAMEASVSASEAAASATKAAGNATSALSNAQTAILNAKDAEASATEAANSAKASEAHADNAAGFAMEADVSAAAAAKSAKEAAEAIASGNYATMEDIEAYVNEAILGGAW